MFLAPSFCSESLISLPPNWSRPILILVYTDFQHALKLKDLWKPVGWGPVFTSAMGADHEQQIACITTRLSLLLHKLSQSLSIFAFT